jgi:hypothetical protein
MLKSIFGICGTAAFIAAVLIPTAASAAVTNPTISNAPAAGDPDTIVTFAVTTGELTMTAPASATLATGTGVPGTTISGLLGSTVVTDDRASLAASWTVSVSSSDFTTGAATVPETVPAADVTYTAGTFFTTGTITVTATPAALTLSNEAQQDIFGTAGIGNNSATWNPTLAVALPAQAVTGTYTGTLTQSVALAAPPSRGPARPAPCP